MLILGIESSCDDTSVALVEITDEKIEILAEKTASQIEIHEKYGGVVPEIAGRMHAEKILPVVEEVIIEANKKIMDNPGNHGNLSSINHTQSNKKNKNQENTDYQDNQDSPRFKPDIIAVTSGPGLITGLLVGVESAKTLSMLWDVPLVGVNHIEGHIHSVKIQDTSNKQISNNKLQYPILSLVASGGHSEIILSEKEGVYEKIGGTRDDAAGECFDKVAKLLGFDYPGGPKISKFAEEGNPKAIKFPRPMHDSDDFDFSFSGLKTSALYWLRDNCPNPKNLKPKTLSDFCASFEQAIIDLLVGKTMKAVKKYQPKTIILGGGVSANKKLRETLGTEIKENFPASTYLIPNPKYAMDNATMIAVASYHHAKKNEFVDWKDLKADPNWKIYDT